MDDTTDKKIDAGEIPLLHDRQSLLALYLEYNQVSRFIVDKIWTNARFFTTITSALLTVTVAALIKVVLDDATKPQVSTACLFLSLLPFMVIILSWIGIRNLRREYERFLNWVTVRSKIQEKIGLYQEVSSCIFPEDRYLLPKGYVENPHESSEAFITSALKSRSSLYFYFRMLQYTYSTMAFLLVVVMLFLSYV